MKVRDCEVGAGGYITTAEVTSRVTRLCDLIRQDFRQPAIKASWQKVNTKERGFSVTKVTLTVTSGTYVRSLVRALAEHFNSPAVVYQLVRTGYDGILDPCIKL